MKRGATILLVLGGLVALGSGIYISATKKTATSRRRKASLRGPRPGQRSQTATAAPAEGRWRSVARRPSKKSRFDEEVERLSALGYLQGYKEAPPQEGVTIHDEKRAYPGLNLYSSGHAEEAGIMDMTGKVVHRWTCKNCRLDEVWTRFPPPRSEGARALNSEAKTHWRRVHLFENGDILAIYDSLILIKLDKDSNLLWVSELLYPHHHLQVVEDGRIFVLVKTERIVPFINKSRPVKEDLIAILDNTGKPISSFSLLEAFFKSSSYMHLLERMPRKGEIFHTNTLQVFDGKLAHLSPLFDKGNLLVSILYLNTIAIVDPAEQRIVWALEGSENGLWKGMHEPTLLENGNMLIFDNNWRDEGVISKSRVVEFEPFSKKIVWVYEGDPSHPFYSRTCGTSQRLPNGNTLITESDGGRAFEVTRDNEIVWEYVSPHRAGPKGQLIATLLHVQRIPSGDSLQWLSQAGGEHGEE